MNMTTCPTCQKQLHDYGNGIEFCYSCNTLVHKGYCVHTPDTTAALAAKDAELAEKDRRIAELEESKRELWHVLRVAQGGMNHDDYKATQEALDACGDAGVLTERPLALALQRRIAELERFEKRTNRLERHKKLLLMIANKRKATIAELNAQIATAVDRCGELTRLLNSERIMSGDELRKRIAELEKDGENWSLATRANESIITDLRAQLAAYRDEISRKDAALMVYSEYVVPECVVCTECNPTCQQRMNEVESYLEGCRDAAEALDGLERLGVLYWLRFDGDYWYVYTTTLDGFERQVSCANTPLAAARAAEEAGK